jgi:hypothetical protein
MPRFLWIILMAFAIGGLMPNWADPSSEIPGKEPTLQQRYLDLYLKIHEADQLEKKGDYQGALSRFKNIYTGLGTIHASNPDWETALVDQRLNDCRVRIVDLTKKVVGYWPGPNEFSPPQTTSSGDYFSFINFSNRPRAVYPWKINIIATIFWIGEASSSASAWDKNWIRSNNGEDNPNNRAGYFPAGHPSTLNPFYVALPFNDLTYPDKARQWLPAGWERPAVAGKPVSACKDRWVEIKDSAHGYTCYAQWEDVGPLRSDHAEYVFGNEDPSPATRPGICVSPAVADYLSLSNHKDPVVRWRFVDETNVPPGMWLKYDEQALIFAALHQQNGSGAAGH